jgi:putative ABC transport system permease protein
MPLIAGGVAVVLRTHEDPEAVMPAVRQAASDLDPGEIIYAVETMRGVLEQTLAARRLAMILLSVFAGLALALACVGIYGVISYVVSERTREIGVRMALGAQQRDVLRLVLAQGARMTLLGTALGMAAALVLTRLLRSQLFGVSADDPVTFAGVAAVLLAVALAACWVPARRAARVDPMVALRNE